MAVIEPAALVRIRSVNQRHRMWLVWMMVAGIGAASPWIAGSDSQEFKLGLALGMFAGLLVRRWHAVVTVPLAYELGFSLLLAAGTALREGLNFPVGGIGALVLWRIVFGAMPSIGFAAIIGTVIGKLVFHSQSE